MSVSPSYAKASVSDPHPARALPLPGMAESWCTEVQDSTTQEHTLNIENDITWNRWFLHLCFFTVNCDYAHLALSTSRDTQYIKNRSAINIQNKRSFSWGQRGVLNSFPSFGSVIFVYLDMCSLQSLSISKIVLFNKKLKGSSCALCIQLIPPSQFSVCEIERSLINRIILHLHGSFHRRLYKYFIRLTFWEALDTLRERLRPC